MRTDNEVVVGDLVAKYKHHLIGRGLSLLEQDREVQSDKGLEPSTGVAVFKQLLEGCLLTLLYSAHDGHQLVILDWHFTDPQLN